MSNTKSVTQLVWFKRDLRVSDHAPLYEASKRGKVLCLYVYEPSLLNHELSPRHLKFIEESLLELKTNLEKLGGSLTVLTGEMPDVLDKLHSQLAFTHLWAHEETGSYLTYLRDRRVRAWAKAKGIPFTEFPSNGVVRRLTTRDIWAKTWQGRMLRPVVPAPPRIDGVKLEEGKVIISFSPSSPPLPLPPYKVESPKPTKSYTPSSPHAGRTTVLKCPVR
jgi:deoxyribodipyrimidine photo-lyase